jgi:hypothetical protein
LVGTWDRSTLRFTVDGKVVAQRRADVRLNQMPTPVEIGSFLGGEIFYGTIDEVALYNRPIDSGTILRHYKPGTSGTDYERTVKQTPGLVGYWRLSDRNAAHASDISDKHPGTYRPGTALEVPGLLAHDANRAAAFDGGQGGVLVEHAADLSFPRGFTLEAWRRRVLRATRPYSQGQLMVREIGPTWPLRTRHLCRIEDHLGLRNGALAGFAGTDCAGKAPIQADDHAPRQRGPKPRQRRLGHGASWGP